MSGRRGFTLIETLVILSIIAILSSVLLLYNRSGERQLILIQQKAKVIGEILRAKSLSIGTFVADEPVCGYGVHFEQQTFRLFKDLASDCSASDLIYSADNPGETVEAFTLPGGVNFSEIGARDILFAPPNPTVFLDGGSQTAEVALVIATADGSASVRIKVSGSGQILE